jgi:tRNA (guanine37-N1)-methyltransferase
MWFGVVTLFPALIESAIPFGIFGRAVRDGRIQVECFNPRDHAVDRHGTVDDKPYGGGAGMVMLAEPLIASVADARRAATVRGLTDVPVILLSARGQTFQQDQAGKLSEHDGLILVCGRYEGVDQRFIDMAVDAELSLGDFVVSGGEVPALLVMDAISRLEIGVVGNPESLEVESHLDGLLEYQQYTRPENVAGLGVPQELLSGDHARITEWRRKSALLTTFERRPELLAGSALLEDPAERARLVAALAEVRGEPGPSRIRKDSAGRGRAKKETGAANDGA